MIKFWIHKYELQPWTVIGAVAGDKPRPGALLKCVWPNGKVGYADLFPWPELGDETLEEQLKDLAQGKLSYLVEQSIWLAKKDAQLRGLKKNAFNDAPKIKNHFLVNDFTKFTDANMQELRSAGYTTIKVKVGRAVDEEAKFIIRTIRQNPIGIRLDFNAKVDFSEFERFATHFAPAERARIEFVEDPIPWHPDAWKEAAGLMNLAIDHEFSKVPWSKLTSRPPFNIVVLKPARTDVEKALHWINRFALKFTISSSLDHPVGMAHASALAAELKKFYPNTLLDCSCLNLRAYKPNEFTNKIQVTGPYLKTIPGTGIGFDELLEKIEWTPVQK